MILPSKHIKFSQSILGLAGFLLSQLKQPKTIDELWIKYSKTSAKKFPSYHDFDNIVLAVNLLYTLEAIELNEWGEIVKI